MTASYEELKARLAASAAVLQAIDARRLLARYVEETPEGMKEDFWCGEYRGRCT